MKNANIQAFPKDSAITFKGMAWESAFLIMDDFYTGCPRITIKTSWYMSLDQTESALSIKKKKKKKDFLGENSVGEN